MKKKLIAIFAIILTIAAFYGIDTLIAHSYSLQIVEIDPQPSYADGKTPVNITVQLKKGDAPVVGHILYMLPKKGNVKIARLKTDADGLAHFVYYPYLASDFIEVGDVPIQVMDESNSVLVSVPATLDFTVELKRPVTTTTDDSQITIEDIFGE
ncbi:MAG: hypothetical protein PUB00_00475 [Clostridiales bacterium]|nr:hypothetical protein [Clostridiales bacterium]